MKKTGRTLPVAVSGVALLFSLGVGSASAAPLDVALYLSPGGSNNGPAVTPPIGTTTYSVVVDPTFAQGGRTFSVGDMVILATGSLMMTAFTPSAQTTAVLQNANNCKAGGPGPLPPGGYALTLGLGPSCLNLVDTGDPTNGNNAPYEAGTLTIVNSGSGAGDLTLLSGDYTSGGFATVTLTLPQVLAQVPEPGSLPLLGVGIGGLGLMIRLRSRS